METERQGSLFGSSPASLSGNQLKVFCAIEAFGDDGGTDEEVQDRLKMKSQSETPRRLELVELGLVEWTGRRRLTQKGYSAKVWRAVGAAGAQGILFRAHAMGRAD